jgi:ElaB/YqjD/DUF883 family membrane-anchored ribosome-binding protein
MQQQQSNEELRQEVERTRARVAADVDAIGNKVSPENVKYQAKQRIVQAKDEAKQRVVRSTRRAGRSLADSARDNPLPLVLVGAGLGWLVYNARQSARRYEGWSEPEHDEFETTPGYDVDYDIDYETGPSARERIARARQRAGERVAHAGERMHEMRERAGERIHHARERAGERIHHAREGAESFAKDNPLAVGAIALAIGASVGLLLPTTPAENRMLGQKRDQLMRRGRQAMTELGEVAEHTAREAARVAKQDIEQRGANLGKGQTVPGGTAAPQTGGPGQEFDSTLGRTGGGFGGGGAGGSGGGGGWEPHQA